jgi:hypothetical protein
MNLLAALDDKNLFKPWIKRPETWAAWRAFIAALYGLPMDDAAEAIYRRHTARAGALPTVASKEAWLICGRRAGKSQVLAMIACHLGAFNDYRPYLSPGERATIAILAADRKQARTIFRYCRALLTEVPMLSRLVERETADSFDLANRVTIEVGVNSYKSTRGYTYAAVLCDEIAFWAGDGAAESDEAVLDAVRPGMSTIPTAMLLCASNPYARKGALYEAHKRWYGRDGAPLIWMADTASMNPTVRASVIANAYERDPISAASEYGRDGVISFRSDVSAFIERSAIEACVAPGVRERPPISSLSYHAFTDPSGGSKDAWTLAVAHQEDGRVVLDCLREVIPPFSPADTVKGLAETIKAYGCSTVTGDRYGGEFPRELFRDEGVTYVVADKVRSDLYRELLGPLNSGQVELLDNDRLVGQLAALERRVARSGRETIDHAPSANAHDDLCNSAAGALFEARARRSTYTLAGW